MADANATVNTLTRQAEVEVVYNRIIPDEVMFYLQLYIMVIICGIISLFGVISNLINGYIFYQLGIKDSMTVWLFGLAETDFVLSFLVLISRVFIIWRLFFSPEEFNPLDIDFVCLVWLKDMMFLCSGWIIAMMSLERCICVIFPFKVKQIFTKRRSIVAVTVIQITIVATSLPLYATQWLEWVTVDTVSDNGTYFIRRLVIMFSEHRPVVQHYTKLLSATLLPLPAFFIILGSIFWMAYGLKKSSQVRKAMTAKNSSDGPESSVDTKTQRLVKVVLALAIIYIVCNIPRTYASFINIIYTEINKNARETNLAVFQWNVSRLFSAINASVNFFVYIRMNSAYRAVFHKTFRCLRRKD